MHKSLKEPLPLGIGVRRLRPPHKATHKPARRKAAP